MATLQQRALVFQEGTSEKFWSIRVDGSTHTVHFGRIGTAGQVKTKSFDSESDAAASAEKLIAAKLRKGYRDADEPASITGGIDDTSSGAQRCPRGSGSEPAI